MVATVVKCAGTISNPAVNQQAVLGKIVTSDTFTGTGDLYKSITDAALGGMAMQWTDYTPYEAAGLFARDNSTNKSINSDAFGAVGLQLNLQDIAVQFDVTSLNSQLNSLASASAGAALMYFDMRRSNASTLMYRIQFHSDGILFYQRDESTSTGTELGRATIKQGDRILYVCKGSNHKIYINGALKITATDTKKVASSGIGFSKGSTGNGASATFDNLIVYSI